AHRSIPIRLLAFALGHRSLHALHSLRIYSKEEDPVKKIALMVALAFAAGGAMAQEKTIKIAGFAAKSGVVRSFGVNSEAAMLAESAFGNVPSEMTMYSSLFYWLKTKYPNAQTVYGGVEEDFAHSRASWYAVMKDRAEANGYKVLGNAKWLLNDSNFATQVREMKKANADFVA